MEEIIKIEIDECKNLKALSKTVFEHIDIIMNKTKIKPTNEKNYLCFFDRYYNEHWTLELPKYSKKKYR